MSTLDRLTTYLLSSGWTAPRKLGDAGGLWTSPDGEVTLPVPNELSLEGFDGSRILDRLAQVEGRSPADMAVRLLGPVVDIAYLRAANALVIDDTIPYKAAVSMLRESWTMLRATATTSLGPRSRIGRYRGPADDLIRDARMAHTTRGSFIIPLQLPIPDLPGPATDATGTASMFEQHAQGETRQRRVMRTFAEALASVDRLAIQPEREPDGSNVAALVASGVSYEFLSAVQRVLRQDSVAEFGARFDWSPLGGPAPGTPAEVNIPAAAAERIERVTRRLRDLPPSPAIEFLTGPIVGVSRDDQIQSGQVTLQVSRNARQAHVTVNVTMEKVNDALDWMKARTTVVVNSRVHRTSSGLMADRRDALEPLSSYELVESPEVAARRELHVSFDPPKALPPGPA